MDTIFSKEFVQEISVIDVIVEVLNSRCLPETT